MVYARFITIAAATTLGATRLAAQSADPHGGMHGMTMAGVHHAGASAVSLKAKQQIDSVGREVLDLGTPEAASGAGYHPVFGWIPTMGVHWVDQIRMNKAVQTDRGNPSQLLFSKINGRDSLVGAAYAYNTSLADTTPPTLFDGAPHWHEHPDLSPPGQRLVMLHIWFVPSPDGPFAGTNPNLPFWAVGLDAPEAARMRDPAFASRVRRAALALAEVADTTAIFPNLEWRPDVQPVLAARRDSIRALIPELRAAQQTKSRARWDRAADSTAAQWDAIYAAYLASARTPEGRQRMKHYIAMLLGQHGE